MAALTHEAKVKIGKRLRTRQEFLKGKPIFETAGWERRKECCKSTIEPTNP